ETEAEETIVTEVSQLSAEEAEEVEAGRAASRAEFAADVAQEHAEHAATHGSHEHGEQEHIEHEYVEAEHVEEEVLSAAAHGESLAQTPAVIEDDAIPLPGETRAPALEAPLLLARISRVIPPASAATHVHASSGRSAAADA